MSADESNADLWWHLMVTAVIRAERAEAALAAVTEHLGGDA